jgi:hypothetical protein
MSETRIIHKDVYKIDSRASDGLNGTSNSLSYRIHEVDRHLHRWERWFGVAGSPSGETHVADIDSLTGIQLTSGNDTYGAWKQLLGSADTPIGSGNAYFDIHRFILTQVTQTDIVHKIQIALGISGAAALTAKTYSECPFIPNTPGEVSPFEILTRRATVGTKAWGRLWVAGEDAATASFLFGIHEYEG